VGRNAKRQASPRVQQKRRQARQDILTAARRVLRERGLDSVTLASVASELGLTKQAIYHYFPSKDALVRNLVAALLNDEIETLMAAVEADDSAEHTLGTLIRAFYGHYVERLDAFRAVYCQSQLGVASKTSLDAATIRDEVNPRTQHLFDVLESRLVESGAGKAARKRVRRLAFTAWSSALGLLTILSIADANHDPLLHRDADLVDTLSGVFDLAAAEWLHPGS